MAGDTTRLVEAGRAARRAGKLEDAHRLARAAIDSDEAAAAGWSLLAQVTRDLGQLDASLALYDRLIALAASAGDDRAIAHALRHAAEICLEIGRIDAADAKINESLRLYDHHAPRIDRANAQRVAALISECRGETAAAQEWWREALSGYREAGVDEGVAECTQRLADIERAV